MEHFTGARGPIAVVLLVIVAGSLGLLTFPAPVIAAESGHLPISEGFDTNSPANWDFYGSDDDYGETHTATSNHPVGPNNEPSLLLTDANGNQAGTGLYTSPFDSSNGITAEFRYYSDGGSGADGFTFFLLDESDLTDGFDASDIGDSGGALGYGDTGGGAITGGFLGIGFDEWGNFDEPAYDGSNGGEDEITIRGSTDSTPAPVVATTDLASNSVDGGWRTVRITVDPTDGTNGEVTLSVYVDFDEDGSYTEVFSPTTYDLNTDIAEEGGKLPSEFRLGFSGSTGGSDNVHAIDDLSVTLPADLTTTVTAQPSNGPYHAGETVEYTVDVTNDGPNDVNGLTLDPSVTTGASGLENHKWDTDNDGSFDDDFGDTTTISLASGNSQTVQFQGTVGEDATGSLDHDIVALTGAATNDPSPDDASASVTVTLNAAPSFSSSESLDPVDEDVSDGSNDGGQIDSDELFGDEFADPDGDSLGGIVATDNAADSSTEGTWQYSTDGGTNWHDVDDGSLAASDGLLLANTHVLRFAPVADFNGNPGDLTVTAVDDSGSTTYTSGATRQTYDTTADGKSSVASTASNTVGITVTAVNDAPSAHAASNATTIDEGEVVGFDATGSTDAEGDALTYNWDVDGDGTDDYTGDASPEHRYNTSGTYTVTVTADDGTTTDTDTVTVAVEAPGGSSGGSGDGDSADGGAGGADIDEPVVTVETGPNRTTTVTIRNVSDRRTATIANVTTTRSAGSSGGDDGGGEPTPGGQADAPLENVTLDELTVDVENVTEGRIAVTAREVTDHGAVQNTDGLSPAWAGFTRETGSVAVGEITVDHTVSDESIGNATFSFSVRKHYLNEYGLSATDGALFRNESTGWTELPTTAVGENATHHRFEAVSPGFSEFVVGTTRPVFEVTDLSLDRDAIAVGESATVTATVANVGGVAGTHDVELRVDGTVVERESVAVDARDEVSVQFTVSPSTGGTHELAVEGTATELAVEQAQQDGTEAPTGESTATDAASRDGDSVPWLALLTVAVVVAASAIGAWHRRR